MASKYGTLKLTDEELKYLLGCVNQRRSKLGNVLIKLNEEGKFEDDQQVKEATAAYSKARDLSIKISTLRHSPHLD